MIRFITFLDMLNDSPTVLIIGMVIEFVGMIVFNLFILKEGFEQIHNDKFALVYLISGTFNIIVACIVLFGLRAEVSFGVDPFTNEIDINPGDILVYLPFSLNFTLFLSLPGIFTYGIVFILTGIKKRENKGTLLIKSGSLGIVYQTTVILIQNLILFILLGLITNYIVFGLTTLILYFTSTGLGLAYSILLTIYGFKSNNLNFKVAGIIFLNIIRFRLVWSLFVPVLV